MDIVCVTPSGGIHSDLPLLLNLTLHMKHDGNLSSFCMLEVQYVACFLEETEYWKFLLCFAITML